MSITVVTNVVQMLANDMLLNETGCKDFVFISFNVQQLKTAFNVVTYKYNSGAVADICVWPRYYYSVYVEREAILRAVISFHCDAC